jgi:hypothetical protein
MLMRHWPRCTFTDTVTVSEGPRLREENLSRTERIVAREARRWYLGVLCVLCVVVLFPVVEGPCYQFGHSFNVSEKRKIRLCSVGRRL